MSAEKEAFLTEFNEGMPFVILDRARSDDKITCRPFLTPTRFKEDAACSDTFVFVRLPSYRQPAIRAGRAPAANIVYQPANPNP